MTVGGLAKEFLVPGWRLGWVLLCDRSGVCEDLRPALQRLTQLVLGACTLLFPFNIYSQKTHYTHTHTHTGTLIQSVLPQVLNPDGKDSKFQLSSFHDAVNERLTEHAAFTVKSLSSVRSVRTSNVSLSHTMLNVSLSHTRRKSIEIFECTLENSRIST